ncbi:MAG: class IV adenylate cyclase [Candidatus Thermoplasmatota archaeon]
MKEIEVKILEIDKQTVEQKLLSLGAQKIFDGLIVTVFFDFPDHRLTKNKNLLRLRKKGSKTLLTLKQSVHDISMKVMQEYEVEISDFENMKTILEYLGFQQLLTVHKHRISYKYNNILCEIDIHTDEFSYIPPFLEIEAETKTSIYECARKLGFNKADCKPWNFYDVVQYYSKKDRNSIHVISI